MLVVPIQRGGCCSYPSYCASASALSDGARESAAAYRALDETPSAVRASWADLCAQWWYHVSQPSRVDRDVDRALAALDGVYSRDELVAYDHEIDVALARLAYPHGWLAPCLAAAYSPVGFLVVCGYLFCIYCPRLRALQRVCATENERLARLGLAWTVGSIVQDDEHCGTAMVRLTLVLSVNLATRAVYEAAHLGSRELVAEAAARDAQFRAAVDAAVRGFASGLPPSAVAAIDQQRQQIASLQAHLARAESLAVAAARASRHAPPPSGASRDVLDDAHRQ